MKRPELLAHTARTWIRPHTGASTMSPQRPTSAFSHLATDTCQWAVTPTATRHVPSTIIITAEQVSWPVGSTVTLSTTTFPTATATVTRTTLMPMSFDWLLYFYFMAQSCHQSVHNISQSCILNILQRTFNDKWLSLHSSANHAINQSINGLILYSSSIH